MTMSSIARGARTYVRAEALVAEIKLRVAARKFALFAVALALTLPGFAQLNLGLYRFLELIWGPVWTPTLLGAGNLLLAIMILLVAARLRPCEELVIAEDVRKTASAVLEDAVTPSIGLGLSSGRDAINAVLPIATALLKAMIRKKPAGKA